MNITNVNKLGEKAARNALAGKCLKASLKEAKSMGFDWLAKIIRQEIKAMGVTK